MKYSNWTVKRQLVVVLVLNLVVVIALALTGQLGLRSLRGDVETIGLKRVPDMIDLEGLNRHRMAVRAQTMEALALARTDGDHREDFARVLEERAASWAEVERQWASVKARPRMSERGRKLMAEAETHYAGWRAAYVELDEVLLRLSRTSPAESAAARAAVPGLVVKIVPVSNLLGAAFDGLLENNRANTTDIIEDANTRASNLTLLSLVVAVVGGLLAIGLSAFSVRNISRTLTEVARALTQGAAQVSSAAEQVSTSSQTLAAGTNQQAASLQQISSSLEELTSTTKHNAESADQGRTSADGARVAAEQGADEVSQMKTAMEAIERSSSDIGKIIKTIDDIAFQTNMLALNAAVEAARAGDAGAGFSVVAEEVRGLAQRAAVAAQDTSEKIVQAGQNSAQGHKLSEHVASGLEEILGHARRVDEIVTQVATASKEQATGLQQINGAVSELDKVTQGNAASAEETASAAEELSAQSEELSASAQRLAALVGLTFEARVTPS